MIRPPPTSTRPDTLLPDTTLFRSLHKARPAMDLGEVDHPQRVRPADADLPVHLFERTWSFGIADGRHASLSAPYPCQAHGAHQPLDRAFGYCRSLSAHLVPDLARAIEAGAVVVDTLDLLLDLVIAPGSR